MNTDAETRRKRSSLRQSLSKVLLRKSFVLRRPDRLKGRYLFRATVRKVVEYMDWITDESQVETITADATVHIKLSRKKKAEKRILTLKDRSVLLTHPNDRTSVEKAYILELFRKFRVFKKYQENLRESLAAVCIYQYVPAGRVIIRQDREAQNLYFLACGELIMSKIVTDDVTGKTKEIDLGVMNAGNMFGEIALLHNLKRSATLISKTSVDLFLISQRNFNNILRRTLMEEWNILQDALIHFNYFQSWNQDVIRECCILSKLQDFQADQVVLGDGKGMVNYVHFLLEGECRLIEHMLIREQTSGGKVQYELYDKKSEFHEPFAKELSRKIEIPKKTMEVSDFAMVSRSSAGSDNVEDQDYVSELSSSQSITKQTNGERMSIITTMLLDVVNEWHEITDVAAMLMRQPSSIFQQSYPPDVRTIFMQICTFCRGACFGLGEQMENRRIVAITPVKCFLVPRYWLLEHNRANIWERVKLFMDSKYPNKQELFREFVRSRRWEQHKSDFVKDIIAKGQPVNTNVTIHDVPYSIRISRATNSRM